LRTLLGTCLLLALAVLAGGCESTQSTSARLAKNAKRAVKERGLSVRRQNRNIHVLSTHAIQDPNGTAVVVLLKNTGKRTLARLPIAIDVRGSNRRSLFRNDTPGLAASLTEVPVLRGGAEFAWVNDQVNASGKPGSIEVKVGEGSGSVARSLPKIELTQVKLRQDPVDGPEAVGLVVNKSSVEQQKLVIFGVSRAGGKIVAAGRALMERLKPGKRAPFQLFFIGDPRRGRLSLSVPPTVLK
jgi:hypothetical protein